MVSAPEKSLADKINDQWMNYLEATVSSGQGNFSWDGSSVQSVVGQGLNGSLA
jgi:hypothetical protein